MAEYGSMFIVGALAAILFFGGWHGPFPVGGAVAGVLEWVFGFVPFLNGEWIGQYVANLIGCVNMIGKASLAVIVMIWIRWTFPRLRIDQVMTLCLKYCVPLAAICFVGVLTWQVVGLPTPNHWIPLAESGEVREPWAEQPLGTETREESDAPPETASENEAVIDTFAQSTETESTVATTEVAPSGMSQMGGAL